MKLIQWMMVSIFLLLGFDSSAASKAAIPAPNVPSSLGFGDFEKFKSFLWSHDTGYYNYKVEVWVEVLVKNTENGPYQSLPGFIAESYFTYEDSGMTHEELIRLCLNQAADKLLTEATEAQLNHEVKFAWSIGHNFVGTNTFKVEKALNANPREPHAVPVPVYRVPESATNQWSADLQNRIQGIVSWPRAAGAVYSLKYNNLPLNEVKVSVSANEELYLRMSYVTNGFNNYTNGYAHLIITNFTGHVFTYDMKNGDLISSREGPVPVSMAMVLVNGKPRVNIKGVHNTSVILTIRKDDLMNGTTYTKTVNLDDNGDGQFTFPTSAGSSSQQYVVGIEYKL